MSVIHVDFRRRRGARIIGERDSNGRFCDSCADLPWRRPASGCPECKEPYQPEAIEPPNTGPQSAMSRIAEEW